jgi:hypothetical protein
VDKRTGTDARSRALHLTRSGRAMAHRILRARQRALRELTDRLPANRRDQLAEIATLLLRPQPSTEQDLAQLCRLCDRSRCPACPVHAGYQSRN